MPYRKPISWGAAGAVIDWGDPVSQSLVGRWLLSNGGATVFDLASRNTGTVVASPAVIPGKFGKALSLNGTSQYINLGLKPAHAAPGPVSISLWLKLSDATAGVDIIMGMCGAGGTECQYSFDVNRTAGTLEALANGTTLALSGNKVLVAGRWYHCVMTRSGATGSWTYTIYVDGILDATGSTAANPDSTQGDLSIGRFGSYATPFFLPGAIDNISLYRRCLRPSEVARLFTEPFAGIVAPRRRIGSSAAGAAFDGALMAAMNRPWPDMLWNKPGAVASGMTPPQLINP